MTQWNPDMMHLLDPFLIFFYRLIPVPIAGYLFGTFCLAMICVVMGQATQALIWGWNRSRLNQDNQEMVRMHNLSLKALSAGDKAAYKASNKTANDAFGKFFFSRMAMGMASLWPAPFALAWMDARFGEVEFQVFGLGTAGYLTTFIPVFVLATLIFNKIKHRIPFFRTVSRQMQADAEAIGRPMRLSDLMTGTSADPTAPAANRES